MKKLLFIVINITTLILCTEHTTMFLGTAYGGWTIAEGILNESSLCYCVGAGEDISFDIELIRHFNCCVYIFDPTPRAIKHINSLIDAYNNNQPAFINHSIQQYLFDFSLDKLNFFPYGIWDDNQCIDFYLPRNPAHVSASIVNLQKTHKKFQAHCKTIKTIMNELNHDHLDLLKLDIEGAEYRVIKNMIDDRIFPTILCIEFHDIKPYDRRETIQSLEDVGYALLTIHEKNNYTFMKKDNKAYLNTVLNLINFWFVLATQSIQHVYNDLD